MSQINSNTKDEFQVVFQLSCFVGHPVPDFKSYNIIKSARVYLMKTVKDCKDVSMMFLQDKQ